EKQASIDLPAGIPTFTEEALDGSRSMPADETFEGSFPGSYWFSFDTNSSCGSDFWDDDDCCYYAGSWGGWCADDGDMTDCDHYDCSMEAKSYVEGYYYGTTGNGRNKIRYKLRNYVEQGYDYSYILIRGYTCNPGHDLIGTPYAQYQYNFTEDFDWTSWLTTLGSAFDPCLYIRVIFGFHTDSSVQTEEGGCLDNIDFHASSDTDIWPISGGFPSPTVSCSVSPTSLSFNVGTIGQSQSRTFTISHSGNGGTLSGSISESCSEFSVSPSSYSLECGESQTISVTYTPQNCGNDTCTLSTSSPCSNVSCSATGPSTPACSVSPTNLSFNVGTIGQSQSRTFTITNTGCGTLAGSVSESCSEFSVSPSSYSLGPNQSSTITVTYTPQNCGNDTCTLSTSSPCSNISCSATGPSTPVCSVSPTSLSFNVGTIGQSQSRTFTITNTACGTLTGSVSESCSEFSVSPSSYSLGPNQSSTITVTYTPQNCGNDNCTVTTSSPCSNVSCSATGPSTPACSVSPTSLAFDVGTIGQSQSRTFTITNTACGTLTGSVSESCSDFSVSPSSYSLGPNQSSTITVTYTPQNCGNDNCTVNTSSPCSNVSCSATGPNTPACSVSPTSLSFNVGTIGQSQSRTFVVTNTTCGTLTGSISESCPEFSVSPGSYSLGPNLSATITVTYTPQNYGNDTCTLDLSSPCGNVSCDATGPDGG
ncbi:choice-of-anchor D domain-containing protein, partial [Candidatus Eisenbacteria bacterium]